MRSVSTITWALDSGRTRAPTAEIIELERRRQMDVVRGLRRKVLDGRLLTASDKDRSGQLVRV